MTYIFIIVIKGQEVNIVSNIFYIDLHHSSLTVYSPLVTSLGYDIWRFLSQKPLFSCPHSFPLKEDTGPSIMFYLNSKYIFLLFCSLQGLNSKRRLFQNRSVAVVLWCTLESPERVFTKPEVKAQSNEIWKWNFDTVIV